MSKARRKDELSSFTMSLFIPSKIETLINLSIYLVGERFQFLRYFKKSYQYLTKKKKEVTLKKKLWGKKIH